MSRMTRLILIAAVAIMFVSVNSCSVVNYFSGYVKSWESKAPGRDTLANGMNRFVGSVRASQGNPDAHYLLGDYHQGRGRHREAIEEFNKAIRIDPLYVKAFNGIAVSLDQTGEHERAQEYYQAALAIKPELDYLYNNLGYSFLLQERYEEAAAAFEKADALAGGQTSRIRNNLALANSALGKVDPATVPDNPRHQALVEYTAANHLLKNGGFEEARDHYVKALTLDPDLRGARKGTEVATLLADVKQYVDRESSRTTAGQDSPVILGGDGIEISNGNGVSGMAKEVGGFLKKQGFNVVRLTNADHYQYAKASVYYRGDAEITALQIKGAIPGITQMKKVGGFDRDGVKVRVLVGRDLAGERNTFKEGEN
jgi:tetratricopeptide (TPR) repeat protein